MRLRATDILASIISFILVFYFYGLVSFIGMRSLIAPGPISEYMSRGLWHLEILIQGTIFGFLFVIINVLTEHPVIQRRSLGFHILLRSLLYFTAMALGGIAVVSVFLSLGLVSEAELAAYYGLLSTEFLISLAVFLGFFIFLMNFMIQINRKFGPGGLWNLISGKYHRPRDEDLIFLFLDLRSSTSLAEKLGHQTYSRFLKDCIHELTPIIQRNRARVHQYVGDEVVLFWSKQEGVRHQQCLRTFFEFQERLRKLKSYFEKTYGEIPEFKAGMDSGEVTITEIGDIKREIAYHGDVVNTASRLEKKCNEFDQDILISENLLGYLEGTNGYAYEFMSDLPLRGKIRNVKFFAVSSS